jgi:hypothetical protein
MCEEFNDASNIRLNRRDKARAREVLHLDRHFLSNSLTPQTTAREYLEKFGVILGVTPQELTHFSRLPEKSLIDASEEYRLAEEKTQFDTTTVVFSQTYLGFPICEAGLSIHIKHNPLHVVNAQSTRNGQIQGAKPPANAINRLKNVDSKALARHLELTANNRDFRNRIDGHSAGPVTCWSK